MADIFQKEASHYRPYLNPVEDYINQSSHYIARKYKISIPEAMQFVKKALKKFSLTNPQVTYREKNEYGDMIETKTYLTKYIKETKEQKDIIAPSFTRYYHPSVKSSVHAKFINTNIELRKIAKHKSFDYERIGDKDNFDFWNDEQAYRKVNNNGLSGSYASKSTFLYNPSAHYTLTSTTRCVSGIGNGVSESIVGGNKYFMTPDSVLNYIACILAHGHIYKIEAVCKKYNLYLPTSEDIIENVLYSSKWYWKDDRFISYLKSTLDRLHPYERAAILYINDLWNLKNHNEEFIRKLIGDLGKPVETGSTDYLKDLDNSIDGVNVLAHHIYTLDLKGKEMDYKKMLADNDPMLPKLASTAKNIKEILLDKADFLEAFFLTDIGALNIAYLKEMMRANIVLSDTDSTCCSFDKWVQWYSGNTDVNNDNIGIAAAVMTITTQLITHHMNILAANLNTGERKPTRLSMKNEFFWPVFVNANVTKHYYATTYVREGNVYKNPKMEIKGVHLIASTIGREIAKVTNEMMADITNTIVEKGKISLLKYAKIVADMERRILNDFQEKKAYMFTRDSIKKATSYKESEEKSKYINHILWENIFKGDYGPAPIPPYTIYRIPLTIKNKTDWNVLLAHLQEVNHGMFLATLQFMEKYNKDMLKTLYIPTVIIETYGIPKEFMPFVDIKKIIVQSLAAQYIILETIGLFRKPGYLLSEQGY